MDASGEHGPEWTSEWALMGFVGREPELARLARAADEARTGAPRLVRIEGPAGIGKTALLRRFLATKSDWTVLRAVCDPAETMLAYGVINQLWRRGPGGAGEHDTLFDVGARLLATLDEAQRTGPVAVVVDDLQWADRFSLRALGFALRRLRADQVLVLLAHRSLAEPDAVEELRLADGGAAETRIVLDGLAPDEVRALAQQVTTATLPQDVTDRLHTRTRGHPLYARVLAVELLPDGEHGTRSWPVSATLNAAVRSSLARLPEQARALVEALAVLDTRSPLRQVARVAGVTGAADALRDAIAADLVEWWPAEPHSPVELRHPLQRDAVYAALDPGRRRELHAAAQHVVDRSAAWAHRVAAATDGDPLLADELEAAAAEEHRRGRTDTAGRYLLWAAELSDTTASRERRLLTACLRSLLSWRADWARRFLAEVEGCADGPLRDCVLGILTMLDRGELTKAEHCLDRALRHPEADWVAPHAAVFRAALALWREQPAETAAAADLALSHGQLGAADVDMVKTLVVVGRSREIGLPAALAELGHGVLRGEQLACRGSLRTMVGDLGGAVADLTAAIRDRSAGTADRPALAPHSYLGVARYLRGEWADAAIAAERGVVVAETTRQSYHFSLSHLCATLTAAGTGDWPTAERHVAATVDWARRIGAPQDVRYAAIAVAVLAHARADDAAVLAALAPVREGAADEDHHTWWQSWWRPLLVDSLVTTGHLDEAARVLVATNRSLGDVPYLAPALARLRGRLYEARGDDHAALRAYQRAPASTGDGPLARALLEQSHGRLLLRLRRQEEAATRLRSAHERFTELGARPYAERCAADLASSGAPVTTSSDPVGALTKREREVAHLVARGFSNERAARELHVSVKTIEYHLGRTYPKLGIRSRLELAVLLGHS